MSNAKRAPGTSRTRTARPLPAIAAGAFLAPARLLRFPGRGAPARRRKAEGASSRILTLLRSDRSRSTGVECLSKSDSSGASKAAASTAVGHARGRIALGCLALAAGLLLIAAPAQAKTPFGVAHFGVSFTDAEGQPATQAGSHPYAMTTSVEFANEAKTLEEAAKDLVASLPAGFVGNPTAAPQCTTDDFLTSTSGGGCPAASVVGEAAVELAITGTGGVLEGIVDNLVPPPGVPAKLGFFVANVPVTIELGVSPEPPYQIVGGPTNISQVLEVVGATLTIYGVPAGSGGTPFLTMPRSCGAPLASSYAADSWQRPGARLLDGRPDLADPAWVRGSSSGEALAGCGSLGFAPEIAARPTSRAATSATGLDFSLDVKNEGLDNPTGDSGADIEKTVVTLPQGMTANPSSANGLGVCTEAQLAHENLHSPPGEGCPDASKLGYVEVETPLLEGKLLKGSLFLAKPYENPFGALIALYVTIESEELGISIHQPLRVEPNPQTGQLVTTAEDMPQLPFSHFRLHFREGARSPLVTPPSCGAHTVKAMLYPSTGGPAVESDSSFEIVSGPDGGPCPSSAPFHPGFEAGTLNNQAGSYSPFDMRLTRNDGEQDMGKFSFVLPPGVVPRLAGIPYCPEAAIAQARGRTGAHGGAEELASPSCPAASQIGTTLAGAGVGSILTYVPGKLYLAGPYHGDPISAVAITPALAGPFDAGVVVVREALRLNPVTHVGEVDGAASDPIPHILKGIPLSVRDLRVYADKPEFTLNATSCEPFMALATIWGDGTALAPGGDTPAGLGSRYQAAGCASLGFEPKLGIKLKGGTKRGRFPALKAVVTPREGDANFSSAVVTLPHSAFLEQGHFGTICTRVQYAAKACPPASVYGRARAWTPLLAEPLEGPVYLRSSNHNLPDLVVALHGLVDIDLAARIDSVHGGIRSTFADVPDAPVSRFILEMRGGKKGLIVNSTNLCSKPKSHRAKANLRGQNGKLDRIKPLVRALGCGKRHRKKHSGHGQKKGGGNAKKR